MARRQINDGEEFVHGDFNDAQALREQELNDRILFQMLQKVENSFFADSFKVNFVDATSVSLNAGLGFQTDATVANTEPQKRCLYSATSQTEVVDDPDTVHDRIDRICVKHGRGVTETSTRKYKATIGGLVTTTLFDVRNDWATEVLIVTGTPSISPAVPAVPSGYISLAQVYVTAVSGIANSAAITDERTLLPVGGTTLQNTTGYLRMTAGTAVPLSTLLGEIDALLRRGYQNYTDFDDLGSNASAPSAGKVRMFIKGGVAFLEDSGAVVSPLGSGGGGGGGANWNGDSGTSPLDDVENGEKVWLFSAADAGAQKLTLFVKVPQGYISGRQITMYLAQYSPSTSGTQLLLTTTSLIRKNLDSVASVANQKVSTNTALTNTVANQYRQVSFDLTDSIGKINGFNVTFGDLLRVDLYRSSDTDTADVRFIPSSTEPKFS